MEFDNIKRFYWGTDSCIRCYMSYGYGSQMTSLIKLFETAKKEFPMVDEGKFEVIQIANSDRVKGYVCISFLVNEKPGDKFEYLNAW